MTDHRWNWEPPPGRPHTGGTPGSQDADAPPGGRPSTSATFPSIPAGPAAEPDHIPRRVLALFLAAVLGAVLGSAGSVAFLDARGNGDATGPATPVGAQEPPRIEVDGDAFDRVAAVAEVVLPSVVRIDIRGGDSPLGGASGNGSGVIYRPDGHIITNHHVIAQANDIEVLFNDGSRADAEVVGSDPQNDLAVIKVDRDGLPAVAIGDSSALQVGELAVAVGSPFGLDGTVTAGVVSALNRPIRVNDPTHGSLTLPNVIQTDASINPGNSGGPLANGEGELIGINSAILTRGGLGQAANAGVGFAIPSSTATLVADQLIEQGEVRYAFLGIAGVNLSRDLAERTGVERGAYVEEVQPGTPAEAAGLEGGDVIVGVGDVAVESMEELMVEIMRRDIGETVVVTYIRNGQERTAEATLTERPDDVE